MEKYIILLSTWDGEFEDLCFELYSMLEKETKEGVFEYFQLICEKLEDIDSDKSRKIDAYFTEGEIDGFRSLYGKYVDVSINSVRCKVVSQKLQIKDFYRLLWQLVFENSILTSEKEKAFGLLWILADAGIPYRDIGTPLSMEDDEYKSIVDDNKESVKRIQYILSIPLKQRTEVASLILNELEGKDYKVQSVLLSRALFVYSRNQMKHLKKILSAPDDENESESQK